MKTIKFFASMGITPGYFHNNENIDIWNCDIPIKKVSIIWQDCAKESLDNGLCTYHISAMIMDSLTVYNTDFGCPYGGERTAFITGEANPIFIKDLELYKKEVLIVLEMVSKVLRQSTTQITFTEVDFHYIKNEFI